MVARAYGKALSDEEIEDVYSAAWAATLSALRSRGESLSDEELRAYVLTAVASHASKELRRRSRKPAGSLDDGHEHSMADQHQLLPEERVIGSEARGIARDLLSSLPPRRRAVMLLRYGWGLSPNEVCALVDNLSSRAYRKEVTRGVEQLIERLKQVESGEWCESREPLLRDYLAGTADEDVQRQAREHLDHCRACSSFTARLSGHLHDLGSAVALSAVAGSMGTEKLTVLERATGALQGARDGAASAIERGDSSLGVIASSGGARGSGAVGAGVVAKLAGLGAAGKAAIACIGASAAASACVAAGVVPGVSLEGGASEQRPDKERSAEVAPEPAPVPSAPPVGADQTVVPSATPEPVTEPANVSPAAAGSHQGNGGDHEEAETPPAPTRPQQEFDSVASAAAPAPAAPAPTTSGSASSGGGSATSTAGTEFGP